MNQNWVKSAGIIWTMMAGLVLISMAVAVKGKTASDADNRSKDNSEKIIKIDKESSEKFIAVTKDIAFIREKLTAIDNAQAVENVLTIQQTKLLGKIMQQLEENEP